MSSVSEVTTHPEGSGATPRSFPAPEPVLLERYVLGDLLGLGGYGEVYRATDTALEREVALKLFGLQVPSACIRREAVALAGVDHRHVLSIHDFQVLECRAFLVMELVLGGSLKERAAQAEDWHEIVTWYAQAARGLEAMHHAGIAHGDVKPTNILVHHRGGHAVVADLGLVHGAKLRWRGPSSAGTAGYMAPERRLGALASPRSDLFSLCVCVCEALFGEQLEHDAGRVVLRRVNTLRRFEGIPAELELGLRRGLSADPAARFEHIGELAALLEDHARPSSRSGLWARLAQRRLRS